MTRFLRIATANIKAYPAMPPRHVWDDLEVVADQVRPDLLATQEMWFPRYRRALRRLFPVNRFGHSTPRSVAGTCVTWTHLFERRETGSRLLHGAVRGVCAWRRIVWVGLTLATVEPTGPLRYTRIAFASVHPIPSAFSDRFRGRKKARVRAAWDGGIERLVEWVEDMFAAGYTHVAIGGDFNAGSHELRRALGGLIDGRRVETRANGIDHVVLIGRWDILTHGKRDARHGDHDPFFVDARPL